MCVLLKAKFCHTESRCEGVDSLVVTYSVISNYYTSRVSINLVNAQFETGLETR